MIRFVIAATFALAVAGGTVAPATERSLTLTRSVPPRPSDVRIYASLCDVPGTMEVVGELEVANAGRQRAVIERSLAVLAGRAGADAIVLHPLNRWELGAAYVSSGPNSFDSFNNSRATAVLVDRSTLVSQLREPSICSER
jgi:hypothetical protein